MLCAMVMVTNLMKFDAPGPALPDNPLHLGRNIYGGDGAHLRVTHPGFAEKVTALAEEHRIGNAFPPAIRLLSVPKPPVM